MRIVTYGAACTLDGFIAGPNGELDWLRWSKDVTRVSSQYMSRVDTILMGRKTYEAGRMQGAGAQPGFANYVFSRSLQTLSDPNATLINRDASEFVSELKTQAGNEICVMGGGELAESLFRADLIDQVGVNIHPTILGRGIPLLRPMPRKVDLELIQSERLAQDCLYAVYRVCR